MEMQIKSIRLNSFKGVKDATYQFGKNTNISGANGVGKSTIATAFYWVLCDRSVELVSNPSVKPIDMEECTPRVEIIADIDGKEIEIVKEQKIKVKEDKETGVKKVSSTNTYEINAVEKSERDFKAYLTDLGIDFDKLLFLSHPDVFTAGMNEKKAREQMRSTLFAMGTEHTDLEIAQKSDDTKDVAELLTKGYVLEEIEAMQNSTIRKIKENYGRDGEVLRAKIEGLESAKVDIEVSDMELGRNSTKDALTKNLAKQEDISKKYAEFESISASIIELKAKQNELQRKANENLVEQKNKLENDEAEERRKSCDLKSQIANCDRQMESNNENLEIKNNEIQKLRDDVKVAQGREFDEKSLVCSYCGQEYPENKKEEIKADFEQHKQEEIKTITKNGKALRSIIDGLTNSNASLRLEKTECEKNLKVCLHNIEEINKKLSELPQSIDVSDSAEYKALQAQIDNAQSIVDKGFNADEERIALRNEQKELEEQLLEFERQIAKAEQNVVIDEQISELLDKQKEYEQSKADAEKILDQLKALSKNKNELLVNDINKNFEIVQWQLFDYQKNGGYKEVCIPLIDGKKFGESTNTGREVLAKLDIIKGLQKFYRQAYPVFYDGAECLSDDTKERIKMNCQIIYLNVSEDKELRIEVNE